MSRSGMIALGALVLWSNTAMAQSTTSMRLNPTPDWPLTVGAVTLRCHEGYSITAQPDGGPLYAVNGTARGQRERRGWRDVREIWRDNPAIPGTKIPITPVLDAGLRLCERSRR